MVIRCGVKADSCSQSEHCIINIIIIIVVVFVVVYWVLELVVSARNVCVYLVYFCFIVCMVASVDGLKPFLATSLFHHHHHIFVY